MDSICRRLFIGLLLLGCATTGFGQEVFENYDYHIAYAGEDNRFVIRLENNRAVFIVDTDNGTVRHDTGNFYTWRPARTGRSYLQTFDLNRLAWASRSYDVIEPPPLIPKLGGETSGTMSAFMAHMQTRIVAFRSPDEMPIRGHSYFRNLFVVNKFTIVVIREGKVVLDKTLENDMGVLFSQDDSVANVIKTLQPKDMVLFNNIAWKDWEDKWKPLAPLVFTITD